MDSFRRLLDLPSEIRCFIYTAYFKTLIVTYPSLTPPLFLVSRQICNEARPYFYPHATFDLLSTEHLIDYLSSIPPSTMAALRHLRLDPERLNFSMRSPLYPRPDLSEILPLCDGLQLDTLEWKPSAQMVTGPLAQSVVSDYVARILVLSCLKAGYRNFIANMRQNEQLQRKVHQDLLNWSLAFHSGRLRMLSRPKPIFGGRLRHDTRFKLVRCITDKGNESVASDWREQGIQLECTWRALDKSIDYGLWVSRDAMPDTATSGVEEERTWTLQRLRQEMDRDLVKVIRQVEHGRFWVTVGRGDRCYVYTMNYDPAPCYLVIGFFTALAHIWLW